MKFIFFFFLILSSLVISQSKEKYFVYFKDKGIPENFILTKNSPEYLTAINLLSERSIERRTKRSSMEQIVTYEDYPIKEEYIDAMTSLGLNIERNLKWFNAVSVYLSEDEKNILNDFPFVEKIEAVKIFKSPNDPQANFPTLSKAQQSTSGFNYGFSLAQNSISEVPQVHAKGLSGEGVLIGVLDTGFDWRFHNAFRHLRVFREYDFIERDTVTADTLGDRTGQQNHGTMVLSVMAGFDNGVLIGPAFNATFLLAKTENLRHERRIEEDHYLAAIEWMENLGVDITSSSLGYSIFDPGEGDYRYSDMNGNTTIVTRAVNLAFQRGVLTFTAAGNEGNSSWRFIIAPADAFNIISVGAVTSDNVIADFSSRGPTADGRIKPEVTAMGFNNVGVRAGTVNQITFSNGTSLATPIAAGIGGLLLQAYPHLTNIQAREIILRTSRNFNTPNNDIGYGLISAQKAISLPTVQRLNNQYKIHSVFFENGLINDSVKVFFGTNVQSLNQIRMTYDGRFKHTALLPGISTTNKIYFYFSYVDSSNQTRRVPSGNSFYSFDTGTVTIKDGADEIPTSFILNQNFPNPFNSGTIISFLASDDSFVEINIYNSIGQKVKTLFQNNAVVGLNRIYWDGKNDFGINLTSGVYFYRLKINDKTSSRKMMLLR
ncbi:MAG: hypothetical protein C0442_10455 [Chlorobiaceae bacterium]|nr:hypothetical protein [Chlorobiaceae bacterium]